MSDFQDPRAIAYCSAYCSPQTCMKRLTEHQKKQALSFIFLKILFLLNIHSISSSFESTPTKTQPLNTHVNVVFLFPFVANGEIHQIKKKEKNRRTKRKTDVRKKITPYYSLNIVEHRKFSNKPRKFFSCEYESSSTAA